MKPLRRLLYLLGIFILSVLLSAPIVIYSLYGFPKYLFTGDSGLMKTWMMRNPLVTFIDAIEVRPMKNK